MTEGLRISPRELWRALQWIDTTPHHEAEILYDYNVKGKSEVSGMVFRGHNAAYLRVSAKHKWYFRFLKYITPNQRAYDTRMYALTRYGRHIMNTERSESTGEAS